MENYAELMFQGPVAELQKADGSYEKYQTLYPHRTEAGLTDKDVAFIRSRESFYLASLTPDGWPYVQHRGGARGFLHVVGPTTLACADYHGNRQFISMGNLETDPRVSLFLMDYLNRARLKIQGRARILAASEVDPELVARLQGEGPEAERVLTIDVVARDWNCPKYIPHFYPEEAVREIAGPGMAALREENARLSAELRALKGGA